jgi:hypothetical protein
MAISNPDVPNEPTDSDEQNSDSSEPEIIVAEPEIDEVILEPIEH